MGRRKKDVSELREYLSCCLPKGNEEWGDARLIRVMCAIHIERASKSIQPTKGSGEAGEKGLCLCPGLAPRDPQRDSNSRKGIVVAIPFPNQKRVLCK